MTERSVVESQLTKKEAEIVQLEEKLKVAKVYVRALQDVLRELGRHRPSHDIKSEASLRKGSVVAQARDLILARRTPMYIDDLLSSLGKDISRESKASLTSALAAYVRKGEIFTRPAPSTFGLIELQHFEIGEVRDEPPIGFGKAAADLDDEIPF
jgi:hypothetical protein